MPEASVVIQTRSKNVPALRVAEKLGFVRYGIFEKNRVEYSQFHAPR